VNQATLALQRLLLRGRLRQDLAFAEVFVVVETAAFGLLLLGLTERALHRALLAALAEGGVELNLLVLEQLLN